MSDWQRHWCPSFQSYTVQPGASCPLNNSLVLCINASVQSAPRLVVPSSSSTCQVCSVTFAAALSRTQCVRARVMCSAVHPRVLRDNILCSRHFARRCQQADPGYPLFRFATSWSLLLSVACYIRGCESRSAAGEMGARGCVRAVADRRVLHTQGRTHQYAAKMHSKGNRCAHNAVADWPRWHLHICH